MRELKMYSIHQLTVYYTFLLIVGFAQGAELDPFAHLSGAAQEPSVSVLSFSNTQNWADRYGKYLVADPVFLSKNWKTRIAAAAPPHNSSVRTRAELDYLFQLQSTRTESDTKRVLQTLKLAGFQFGRYAYSDLTDRVNKPRTAQLADAILQDSAAVMFQMKRHFDRVRPSYLDKRLKPVIAVPQHPAYPSGHATQAFVWAFVLMEMFPESDHGVFLASAKLIAQDREVAGVHYPSDTQLGFRLARQVVDMWLANERFTILLEAAKREW